MQTVCRFCHAVLPVGSRETFLLTMNSTAFLSINELEKGMLVVSGLYEIKELSVIHVGFHCFSGDGHYMINAQNGTKCQMA